MIETWSYRNVRVRHNDELNLYEISKWHRRGVWELQTFGSSLEGAVAAFMKLI